MNARPLWHSTAVLFSAFAGVANAQAPYFVPQGAQDRCAWPSGYGTPAFKRLIAGNLDADGVRDVVSLSGTQPVMYQDAAYHDAPRLVGYVANDIDLATGAGTGGLDAIALVNHQGLNIVPMTTTFATVLNDGGQWTDARKVRCGDVNTNGTTDYVGVGSDGMTVLLRYGGGSSTSSFTINTPILDLGLLQWDNDSALEVALLTDLTVLVYDLDGATLGTLANSFANDGIAGGAMTTVKGLVRDRVAWIHATSSGQVLKTLRRGGVFDGPIALPAGIGAYALTTGDAEGDGDPDLIIANHANYRPLFLVNLNQGPTLPWLNPPSSPYTWDDQFVDDDAVLASYSGNAQCAPLYADLDGDGRADLYLAMEQTSSVAHEHPAHVFLAGSSGAYNGSAPEFLLDGFLEAPGSTSSRAFLRFRQPDGSTHPNRINVYVWSQDVAYGYLNDTPVWMQYDVGSVTWLSGQDTYLALELSLPEGDHCFLHGTSPNQSQELYWFEVQPSRVDGSGATVQTWPTRIGGMSASMYDVSHYLQELLDEAFSFVDHNPAVPHPLPPPFQNLIQADPCSGYTGATPAPAVVNRRRLASFNPYQAPSYPQAPTQGTAAVYSN